MTTQEDLVENLSETLLKRFKVLLNKCNENIYNLWKFRQNSVKTCLFCPDKSSIYKQIFSYRLKT